MDSKQFVNKYWKFILVFIAIMVIVSLYEIGIFARVIANKDVYASIEIALAIFITAALLYILMALIDRFNQE